MKKILLILCLISFVQVALAGTYVKGYYRKDGTYVAPYYRQDSYKQTMKKYNVSPYNPNTGKVKIKQRKNIR